MTGRLNKLLPPFALLRWAAIPLLAFVTLVVNGNIYATTGQGQGAGNNTCVAKQVSCFNPSSTSTYCKDGTGDIDQQQLTASCQPDISPGSHPDVVSTFDIGVGPDGIVGTPDDTNDYNFGGVLAFSPTVPDDTAIPVGAILGKLGSQPTLGLVNNGCSNSQLRVGFTFQKGTTDIHDIVTPRPFGEMNDLAIMAGDSPPYDGVQDVKPSPAVVHYPSFLNAIFDPNWVDFGPDKIPGTADDTYKPGTSPTPIKPVFRAVGVSSIPSAGNLWVILQLVIFDKGTKLPRFPQFDPAYGYPSVVVLQQASASGSASPPAPSAVTDFCTPLKTVNVSYGETKDNPDTPANEGGIPLRTLPDAGTQIPGISYGASQRDTDGDGIENSLDPCPLNADTVWDPRGTNPQPADQDSFAGTPVGDGIPDTCDPSPTDASPAIGGQPTDYDGDGFLNRGDNCPLVANPDQKDSDLENGEKAGDDIGDACDPNPGTPDGAGIKCIKTSVAVVGGDPNVAYSGCLTDLPPVTNGTIDTSTAGGGGAGGAENAAAGAGAAGTSAGRGSAAGGAAAGGVGGPASGVGSLSPVGGSVPAWAAIAAALGAAGVIGSLGTMASRLIKRRRNT